MEKQQQSIHTIEFDQFWSDSRRITVGINYTIITNYLLNKWESNFITTGKSNCYTLYFTVMLIKITDKKQS